MFISKKHLPRRTVLRGVGATLALPLLESMVPALTALSKTAAKPIRRLGVFYVPNGMSMPYWYPSGLTEGSLDELPPILSSLNELKDRVLICGGLACEAALLLRGGDHSKSSGPFLTGTAFNDRGVTHAAVSMDVRSPLGSWPKRPSSRRSSSGSRSQGCSAPATGRRARISTRSPGARPPRPLPIENNPRALFERLFGGSGSTDSALRAARVKKDRSILDFVNSQAASLQNVVGPQDRQKLSEYFDSIRDIEPTPPDGRKRHSGTSGGRPASRGSPAATRNMPT